MLVGMSSARNATRREANFLCVTEHDFSKAKRANDDGRAILRSFSAESKCKTRITIMLDNDLLDAFRARAKSEGTGYQTLINRSLRSAGRLGSRG